MLCLYKTADRKCVSGGGEPFCFNRTAYFCKIQFQDIDIVQFLAWKLFRKMKPVESYVSSFPAEIEKPLREKAGVHLWMFMYECT